MKKTTLTIIEFIDFIKRFAMIVPSIPEDYLVEKIKRTSEVLNNKCEFKNNKCKMIRQLKTNKVDPYSIYNKGCCCGKCEDSGGYLKRITSNNVATYYESWKKGSGFLEEGKGCRLPRELRSKTCICYQCQNIQQGYLEAEKAIISLLHSLPY